jgi:integrase
MPLTARKVETAKPGRHSDGAGLSLLVQASGGKSWVLRVQIDGRRRDCGLGSYPSISLAEARDKARELRKAIKAGQDPRAKAAKVLTFKEAARRLIELKRPGWRNAKHAAQWTSTLSTYVYPTLGERDVRSVGTADVLAVLEPIWTATPETASRIRQRIEAVLDYASAVEAREGANPARWRGHLANLLPRPGKVRAVRHHAALDWREAPAFWATLQKREGSAAHALAFAILTAARSGEVRGMTWDEIDPDSAVWTVPAARIKAGREHRVPLVPAALALLGDRGKAEALVFPSPSRSRTMLSDMALTAVLRRMGRGDLTVHGFRSTFRDWAGETSGHPREVIEQALAHRLKDKAEAAYARGDLFQKRRKLMTDWAAYLEQPDAVVARLPRPRHRVSVARNAEGRS